MDNYQLPKIWVDPQVSNDNMPILLTSIASKHLFKQGIVRVVDFWNNDTATWKELACLFDKPSLQLCNSFRWLIVKLKQPTEFHKEEFCFFKAGFKVTVEAFEQIFDSKAPTSKSYFLSTHTSTIVSQYYWTVFHELPSLLLGSRFGSQAQLLGSTHSNSNW